MFKKFIYVSLVATVLSISAHGTAATPQECSFFVYGARNDVDMPTREGDLMLYAMALETGRWASFSGKAPESLMAESVEDGTHITLTRVDVPAFYLFSTEQLFFYDVDDEERSELEGAWRLMHEGTPEGVIHFLPPVRDDLTLQVDADAQIHEPEWVSEDSSLDWWLQSSLLVKVPVPQMWKAWYPPIEDDALFAIRVSIDDVPDADPLRKGDTIAVAEEGQIYVNRPLDMMDCWASHRVNWTDARTLHGLIWPLGADSDAISMRFSYDLASLREDAIQRMEAQLDAIPRTEDPPDTTPQENGCAVAGGGFSSWIYFLVLSVLLFPRREERRV